MKLSQNVKELAETISIVRGFDLIQCEQLTVSRADDFVGGKVWAAAQKREEELIAAQFDSIKATLKTMSGGFNAIVKMLAGR